MHFSLGRSTLVPNPSALPRSNDGSLLSGRCLGFALAFLVRSLLLTFRLAFIRLVFFFFLFFLVLLIGILVGRLIAL